MPNMCIARLSLYEACILKNSIKKASKLLNKLRITVLRITKQTLVNNRARKLKQELLSLSESLFGVEVPVAGGTISAVQAIFENEGIFSKVTNSADLNKGWVLRARNLVLIGSRNAQELCLKVDIVVRFPRQNAHGKSLEDTALIKLPQGFADTVLMQSNDLLLRARMCKPFED